MVSGLRVGVDVDRGVSVGDGLWVGVVDVFWVGADDGIVVIVNVAVRDNVGEAIGASVSVIVGIGRSEDKPQADNRMQSVSR